MLGNVFVLFFKERLKNTVTDKGIGKAQDDTKKSQKEPSAVTDSQAARLAGKEAEKKQRRIKKLEEMIEELESRIEDLKEELCKPEYATDYDRLSDIQGQIDAAEEELLETMQEWERQQ